MKVDDHSRTIDNTDYPVEQRLVDEFFDAGSTSWAEIYQRKDVFGIIHQQRFALALKYVDELSLPKTSRVLEIGCGAGLMAIALAKRGFTVEAVDSVPAMIRLTQRYTRQTGTNSRIHAAVGNVYELAFEDGSFDLIVALGLIPWLHNLRKALVQITRVLVPDGYLVLNSDNRYRLNYLIDPLQNPAFEAMRKRVRHGLERAGLRSPRNAAHVHMYSIKEFNEYLRDANLTSIKNSNLGFGPFTLFNHNILSDRLGVKIHQKLQQYADARIPVFRSIGAQYVVLARKNS
jgi:ubiquinone/menaquinone biosynthesis C-methylase UbiE